MTTTATVPVNRHSLSLLTISIGIIYLRIGVLKFFHRYSPAEDLAINTIDKLTFGLISQSLSIMLLAGWECALGIFLITRKWLRTALLLLLIHMVCTFTPLLFFPSVSFKYAPYGFTLVGQYIMKNIIIICAALLIWPQKSTPANA